jgi:hypothetical protein
MRLTMEVHFALVLDRNIELDLVHWPASSISATRATLSLQHDGHVILLPRKPGDRRLEDVTALHATSGSRDPAGVYQLG